MNPYSYLNIALLNLIVYIRVRLNLRLDDAHHNRKSMTVIRPLSEYGLLLLQHSLSPFGWCVHWGQVRWQGAEKALCSLYPEVFFSSGSRKWSEICAVRTRLLMTVETTWKKRKISHSPKTERVWIAKAWNWIYQVWCTTSTSPQGRGVGVILSGAPTIKRGIGRVPHDTTIFVLA